MSIAMRRRSVTLHDDGEFVLLRVAEADSARACLVLAPSARQPSLAALERLRREHALKDCLDDTWAARPLALDLASEPPSLSMHDPGGRLLMEEMGKPWPVDEFLKSAIGVTVALGRLHDKGLVHLAIQPACILIDMESGQAWLTGFGNARLLPREGLDVPPLQLAAAALAYVAPEQTGRMGSHVDGRSDLYAVGTVLYQMLTGAVPFSASDPLEWVHCHLAKQAVPPSRRVRGIPEQLDRLVLKLLAKPPEERYQTAAGVEADLRRCLASWRSQARIPPFEPGTADLCIALPAPARLYGREQEVTVLRDAFSRVAADRKIEAVLVSGCAGIGKSALVHEFYKSADPQQGLFAAGKFDQFKRDIPYATLAQAVQSLVGLILSRPEDELARWTADLQAAVSPYGDLVTSLAPDFQLIVGRQPPLPELPPRDTQLRFQAVISRLLQVLARPGRPLVLFFDDLQWVDFATLDLLEYLLVDAPVHHLLLVAAYRNDEIEPTHPLVPRLAAMRRMGRRVRERVLAPLQLADTRLLVADVLRCSPRRARRLAVQVHARTAGNPFFAAQFLAELVEEGLITFEAGSAGWAWNTDRIAAKAGAATLAELMAIKIDRLPASTQQVMKVLACWGISASTSCLAMISGSCGDWIHKALAAAVKSGLVLQQEDVYSLAHDRVQEAVYATLAEDERAQLHLRIGRLMADRLPVGEAQTQIFEIVNQLNRGRDLLTVDADRIQAAHLNLSAAHRAKTSTAFDSALAYARAGLGLLGTDSPEHRRALWFQLSLLLAECEMLLGRHLPAEEVLADLISGPLGRSRRASAYRLLIVLHVLRSDYATAVERALECLRLFGIDMAAHPCAEQVDRAYRSAEQALEHHEIEDLVYLPMADDPAAEAAMSVLSEMFAPACFTDENLALLHLCHMVDLSLRRGVTPASAQGFAWFGIMIGHRFGRQADGLRFARLSRDLVERHGFTSYEAKSLFSLEIASVWTQPLGSAVEASRAAFAAGARRGDIAVACFACNHTVNDMLVRGDTLEEVAREAETGLAFVRQAGYIDVVDEIVTQQRFVQTMRGQTPSFASFDGDDFDEAAFEAGLTPQRMPTMSFWYWVIKGQARFSAGRLADAWDALERARDLLWSSPVHVQYLNYHLFSALALAALLGGSARDAGFDTRRRRLSEHRDKIASWREGCRETFADKVALVDAEIARIEERPLEAERLYQEAIDLAGQNGFVQNEALANELCARFHAGRGFATISQAYLRNAVLCYQRWGATGKVRQLEDAFLQLKVEAEPPRPAGLLQTPLERLDWQTIVKISQAVSSEIVLEKLVRTLLVVALEHAGAQRGLLILSQDGVFKIQAEATTRDDEVQVRPRAGDVTSADLPESVLRYVTRTQTGVLLEDAAIPNQFLLDPYLVEARPRSLLCLPIVKQGSLIGVLYLENDLATRVFTRDRYALLQLLASQAAISLENARLYEKLSLENRNRQLAEEARELMNAELQESESRFRGMADATPDVIWITDLHPERVLYVSPSFERIWGRTAEDLYADPRLWTDGIHPEDRPRVNSSFASWLEGPSDARWGAEFRVVHTDGTTRWIHDRGVFIRDGQGGSRRVSGISTDITDRREAESALREAESRFALAVAGATDGVWDWDIESGRMFFSKRAQVLHGLEPGQTVRQRMEWRQMFKLHPEDAPRQKRAVDDYLSGRADAYDGEWRVLHGDGAYRWVRMRGLCLRDASGRATRMAGSVSDIDAAKRAEAAVKESEERFALAVAGSNHGIWDWDIKSGRMFFSELAQRLFGLEPGVCVRQRSEWRKLAKLHPDDADRQLRLLEGYLEGGPPYDGEWRVLDLQGHYRWIRIRGICVRDEHGNPTRMAGSVTDIDSQKRTEGALLQAQRLEAAGSLAGGIAHDFNNILAAILGYGEMALRDVPAESRMRRDVESIMIAGERGRALVERILAFSRSSVGERVPVNVEEVVEEAIDLLSATLPAGVQVVARLRGGNAAVLGDATQIHQVVMNLATNGIQALAGGGTLKVSLEALRVPSRRILTTGGIDPGDYLVLDVTDNGTGIEQEVLDRIFDPFFTTKDPGVGTGLGLSLVHGIVMEVGGAVNVESSVGAGSTFTVYLPRVGDSADEEDAPVGQPPRGRGQQVLVVDDEPLLVTLMTETLEELGYLPVGLTSGDEALAAFRSSPEQFEAVITDERMPGISGAALIREVRKLRSGIPILMVSGFLGGKLAADARAAGADDVLTKPVSAVQLATTLARVLHGE